MRGSVYKIVNTQNDYVHVGSTKQSLSRRMATHRNTCKKGNNKKLYKMMRRIGIEHFKIVLLEIVEFEDIYELRKKEDEYIVKFSKDRKDLSTNTFNPKRFTSKYFHSRQIYKQRLNRPNDLKVNYMKRCSLCNTLFLNSQEIKKHYKSAKHKKKCKMFTEFKYNEVIGELHQIFD